MSTPTPGPSSNEDVQKQWDDLQPMEVDWTQGQATRLIDAIVTKYGISPDEAARQVTEFMTRYHVGKE